MKFANRMGGITTSPTIAVMQEAQQLKAQGIDVIDLGPGEPDFPTPEPIKAAAVAAIEEDFTKYTAAIGIAELRKGVAEHFNNAWGSSFQAAHVALSAGAKHTIHNLCMSCFEAGDEVLIPAPYWVTFPEVVRVTEAEPRIIETREEDNFELRPEVVEEAIGPRTRGLILNTPNNPTGAVIPRSALQEIYRICKENSVLLLSDETYDYFVYDGREHFSIAGAVAAPDDPFFALIGSFSKTYSMTGWRVGYCITATERIKKVADYQSHESGNPASVSQKAALAALSIDPSLIAAMTEEYRHRRELVLETVADIPGFSCAQPSGAFYAYPNVSEAMRLTGCETSVDFSRLLIKEAQVATVPGSAFGTEGYIRLSYATSRENLREAFSRIRRLMEG